MSDIITRAQIGLRPRDGGGTSLPLTAENVAYHWPGSASVIDARGDAGFRRVCSALRGWQAFHMDGRGWSDIAYQMAVDNEGRIYTLRGINIQSGANGDGPTNRRYGAILLILGPGEQMSDKMKAACRRLGAMYRARFKRMPSRPTWHGAVRPGGTSCPGPEAISEIKAGSLDAGTTPEAPKDWFDMATETQLRTLIREEIRAYFRDELYNLKANGTAAKNHEEVERLLREVPEATATKVWWRSSGLKGADGKEIPLWLVLRALADDEERIIARVEQLRAAEEAPKA